MLEIIRGFAHFRHGVSPFDMQWSLEQAEMDIKWLAFNELPQC